MIRNARDIKIEGFFKGFFNDARSMQFRELRKALTHAPL